MRISALLGFLFSFFRFSSSLVTFACWVKHIIVLFQCSFLPSGASLDLGYSVGFMFESCDASCDVADVGRGIMHCDLLSGVCLSGSHTC